MANVIIPNRERMELAERIGRDHNADMSDPAMREAAVVAAARTQEVIKTAQERRRYYYK